MAFREAFSGGPRMGSTSSPQPTSLPHSPPHAARLPPILSQSSAIRSNQERLTSCSSVASIISRYSSSAEMRSAGVSRKVLAPSSTT